MWDQDYCEQLEQRLDVAVREGDRDTEMACQEELWSIESAEALSDGHGDHGE